MGWETESFPNWMARKRPVRTACRTITGHSGLDPESAPLEGVIMARQGNPFRSKKPGGMMLFRNSVLRFRLKGNALEMDFGSRCACP